MMKIGDVLWKMCSNEKWAEDGHYITETVWEADPYVIIAIEGDTIITNHETVSKDKIGVEFFNTQEECYASFDKPLRIDGPVLHTVPSRDKVGHAFTEVYMVPREGTQILIGYPYESNLPNSQFFGERESVSLKEIREKYDGEDTLTVIHEGAESGEIFQLKKDKAYWTLLGVTSGLQPTCLSAKVSSGLASILENSQNWL